jgi:superfamily I DNA/RNA helicase
MFAQHFFTDPSSPKPNLPAESKRSFGIPILYEYSDIDENIIFILRQADSDPRNLIAIITATDAQREIYYERLQSKDINLDNPRSAISTYSNKSKASVDIDFSIGGIVVLNDTSVKGLEFDIVFIVIDGFKIYNNDTDSMKKRFYVMSSRAIKKLVLLKSIDNKTDDILNILPNDENILKRETTHNG